MAGYTRQDTANNIANGNVIDADDFDAEYNAIESAFNNTSGHSHDGTAGEGAPITKVGPAQDLVISGVAVTPKSTNTLDLGSPSVEYKDAFFDGTVVTDDLIVDETALFSGAVTMNTTLDVMGNVGLDGDFDVNTNKFTVAALSGNTAIAGTLGVTGGTTLGAALGVTGNTNIGGTLGVGGAATVGGAASVGGNFSVATSKFTVDATTGNTVVSGTLGVIGATGIDGNFDVATNKFTVNATSGNTAIAGALAVTGASTLTGAVSAPAGVTGNLTGNVTGSVTGNVTGNLTGNVTGNVTGDITGNLTGNVTSTGANTMGSLTTTSDVTVGGDLTVLGTTTTVNVQSVNVEDTTIILNSTYSGSTPTQNAGIEVNRGGGTEPNKSIIWDETADKWSVDTETFVAGAFEGNLTGNVTGNVTGDLTGDVTGNVTGDVVGNVTGDVTGNAGTATALQTARNIAGQSFDGTADITIAPDDLVGVTATAASINTASTHYVPSGGIIMWSGAVTAIPTGWYLCNGTNGTPNLIDRFIIGSGTDTGGTHDVGDVGGANSITLTTGNLPSHTHSFSGTTSSDGAHSHTFSLSKSGPGNGNLTLEANTNDLSGSGTTSTTGAHTHTFSGTTGATGSGAAIDNRPAYYALAFIMKA